MRLTPVLLVLAAGLSAQAQTVQLSVEVSKTGLAGSWSNGVTADPGESVFARVSLALARSGAFGGLTITQIDAAGAAAGESATNFAGYFAPNTQTFALLGAGSPGSHIGRTDAPGNIIFEKSPGVNDNPATLATFKYNAAGSAGHTVVLNIFPADFVSGFLWLDNTQVPLSSTEISFTRASIHVTPAPGAALLLAPLAFPRRRR